MLQLADQALVESTQVLGQLPTENLPRPLQETRALGSSQK